MHFLIFYGEPIEKVAYIKVLGKKYLKWNKTQYIIAKAKLRNYFIVRKRQDLLSTFSQLFLPREVESRKKNWIWKFHKDSYTYPDEKFETFTSSA